MSTAAEPTALTGTSPTDEEFSREWENWRTQRLAALRAPDGPPTLVATHWLAETEPVPGVPGRWSQTGGRGHSPAPSGHRRVARRHP